MTTESESATIPTAPTQIILCGRRAADSSSGNDSFVSPSISWILGTWHVKHSTLPMWKKARNVAITYKPLSSDADKLDDLVTYQALTGKEVKTISGVDTPAGPGSWNWRGNGWLMMASAHWEVLGYGDESDGEGGQWVVTYFAKSLFSPAGIDIYSRRKEGLRTETVEGILKALEEVEDELIRKLAGEIFLVKSD